MITIPFRLHFVARVIIISIRAERVIIMVNLKCTIRMYLLLCILPGELNAAEVGVLTISAPRAFSTYT